MSVRMIERDKKMIEKKHIPVSSKRQITIPKKFFEALDLESEVECVYTGDEIIIRPLQRERGYFAQEILNELIDSGYSGDELKEEFARLNKEVRPAVKRIIEDAKEFAKKTSSSPEDKTSEIFGTEE